MSPESQPDGPTLRKAYEDGASISRLGAKHGLGYGSMRRLLRATGVTMRQGTAKVVSPPITPEQAQQMVTAYEDGATVQEIADAAGRTYDVARRAMLRCGVELRQGGPRNQQAL